MRSHARVCLQSPIFFTRRRSLGLDPRVRVCSGLAQSGHGIAGRRPNLAQGLGSFLRTLASASLKAPASAGIASWASPPISPKVEAAPLRMAVALGAGRRATGPLPASTSMSTGSAEGAAWWSIRTAPWRSADATKPGTGPSRARSAPAPPTGAAGPITAKASAACSRQGGGAGDLAFAERNWIP